MEILYDEFVKNCITDDDYVRKMFEMVSDFKEEQNGSYYEDRPRDPGLQSYLAQFNFSIMSKSVNNEYQYQYQYAGNGQYQRIYSYKETCILLQNIAASDNMTSLDVLENAEEAEKRATARHGKLGSDTASDILTSTSQDMQHQVDADSLLKEILDNRF